MVYLARYWLGATIAWDCQFEKALHNYEKALDINMSANSLWGISQIKSLIAVLVYWSQGKIDLGYQTSHEALRIAEESGDIYSKAMAYTSHGFSCYGKGFLEEAEEHILKAIDFCERVNSLFWGSAAHMLAGLIYCERGKYQKSQDYHNKAISLMEYVRLYPSIMNLMKIALTRAKVLNNEKDVDLVSLYGYQAGNKIRFWEGEIQRYIGQILLNIDDQHISEAEDWIKKAIEANKRNGTMFYLGTAYTLYAELLQRKGDLSEARENLKKAIEIYKECGADGWLKWAEEALTKKGD